MSDLIKLFPLDPDADSSLPSIICLGNFDGVHVGHSALIKKAIEIKAELTHWGQKMRVGALCFDSLPSEHLGGAPTPCLMSLDQKLEAFRQMGLECAYVCKFSSIKSLSPEDFIKNVLRKECLCVGAVCGFNFRFGKGASGDAELLVSHFESENCAIVPPVTLHNTVVSSSHIRGLIRLGQMEKANEMLGHRFTISHPVVHGKHLGTSLGFPTLNHIFSDRELIPHHGIYATETLINGVCYKSVTNIGVRPTVSTSSTVTCETHIIGIDNEDHDFYGEKADVIFHSKLRDEIKFESHEQLSKAIAADVEATKKYFGLI